MWPACIASVTSTYASADPLAVVIRARPPVASPSRVASAGLMRSAPAPSRLRHAGSRMIVLAVFARRSPADRTSGSSSVVWSGGAVASVSSSASSSGISSAIR